MRAVDALELLELLGSSQWGLVTTSQAQEVGVSKMRLKRLTDDGTLQRVRHGVYALPSAAGGSLQALQAAWLFSGQQAGGVEGPVVVSGESAAAVHQFGDLVPSKHELTTPVRRQTTQPDLRYRKRDLAPQDVVDVDGLPVTSVPRTVADLAAAGGDYDHLTTVVSEALNNSDVTADQLADALAPHAARFGHDTGEELLEAMLEDAGHRDRKVLTHRDRKVLTHRDRKVLTHRDVPDLRDEVLSVVAPHLDEAADRAVRDLIRRMSQDATGPLAEQLALALRPQTEDPRQGDVR